MNVIINAVVFKLAIATALVAVCDVSLAAHPAALKSVQPRTAVAVATESATTEKLVTVRDAGRKAQQQIVREAVQQSMLQLNAMPLTLLVPISDDLVTDRADVARHIAVK